MAPAPVDNPVTQNPNLLPFKREFLSQLTAIRRIYKVYYNDNNRENFFKESNFLIIFKKIPMYANYTTFHARIIRKRINGIDDFDEKNHYY